MKIINKSFKEWKEPELKKYLGLVEEENLSFLAEWLSTEVQITKQELSYLQNFQQKAKKHIRFWNEMELRHKFITPLTLLVDFDNETHYINSFTERKLSGTIQNRFVKATLYGSMDWLLATGLESPEHPFFFIHEYKKEKGGDNDPLGQLLAAMVVAQELNQEPPQPTLFNPNPIHFYKDMPIYGAYVLGRNWFFVVLKETTYSISQPFVATKMEDLQDIFKILKAQKQLIYSYLEK